MTELTRRISVDTDAVVEQESSPIIIYGAPRSGTTYLTHILNEHPEIFISHETRVFAWAHRSLNELTQDDEALLSYRDKFIEQLRAAYPKLIRDFYHTLAPRARYWGDKNPHYASQPNQGCLDMIVALFPSARFIHIIRDGRDVVTSLMKKGWVNFDIAHSVWTTHVDIGGAFGKNQPRDRYFELRYEDLIQDDASVVRGVFDFLGIEMHHNVVTFCQEQKERRTPLSEPTRDLSDGVATSNWDKTLTLAQQTRSFQLLAQHLVRLGYETASSAVNVQRELTKQHRDSFDERIRNIVDGAIPPNAIVIVVYDDDLLELNDRQAWHFIEADRSHLRAEGAKLPKLLAANPGGSVDVLWIQANKTYSFFLYGGPKRTQLATVTVAPGEKAWIGAISGSPPKGDGSRMTKITWSTGDGSQGRVFVSEGDQPETLVAKGPEGSIDVPCNIGATYEFRLYAEGEDAQQLTAAYLTVRSEKARLGVVPDSVPAEDGPRRTEITWSTGDGSQGQVFTSEKREIGDLYPVDSVAAIDRLEALRAKGGDFLLCASTALWWFDHYAEFKEYLENRYREVVSEKDICRIFDLRNQEPPPSAS